MDPQRFAVDWIAAWNAHDLDGIVAHYADDVELHSPCVARLTGDPAGVLYGKAAVRDYCARGLERFPDLRFTLRGVLAGAGSLAIDYEGVDGRLASETMEFDGGLVVRVLVHYRTPAPAPLPVPNINAPVFDEEREHAGYEARRARIGYQLATARLGISLWELPAGQAAYPYHAHLAEEELVVVLEGALELRRPTGWSDLAAGDVVGFPVGSAGAHQLINRGAETARFLAISTNGQPDVVLYPDWGNVFAGERRPLGGGVRLFFREADAVDYYDGAAPPPERPDDATTP